MIERPGATTTTFGALLKRLRKRDGMTQDDLAAAIGYSRSLVGALERNERLPAVEAVIQTYLPALGLQDEPLLAAQLIELAAQARGERPPSSLSFRPEHQRVMTAASEAAHRLPLPAAGILGRDEEIDRLCHRLLGHHGRLLTLVGPPGVGKTRLAQAVGAQLQAFHRDGACFVPLAQVADPALVATTLLSALKLHEFSARPPQTRLIEHLRRQELLLVLDNFEQLISADSPAVALVAELLAECPDLRLLVTSHERLHLRAEQRYRVQPLALAAAVDLFVARCSAVESDFVLAEADRPLIEAICQQVDCLPLAIELCAAQIDLLSLPQLLAGLRDRRLELLVGGAQDLPPHHHTLRRAIGHSYNLLDDEERRLLRRLGIFVGGCALEELAAVSAGDQEPDERPLFATLHALIGKSLVRVEMTPGSAARYLLLETIREFALEQVRAEGEEDRLRRRHYAATLQLLRRADVQLRGPDVAAWLARLEPEQDNLRAALKWALDGECYADMAWLLLAAWWFWFHIGRWHELCGWLAQLLPHREMLEANVRLATLNAFWAVRHTSDESRPMDRYTDEILGLVKVCPEQILHSAFWHFTAIYATDFAEASAAWERSIACGRAACDEPALGPEFGVASDRDFIHSNHLMAYADRLIEHGEFERAAPLLMENTKIFQVRGNRYGMVGGLGTEGQLALLVGDTARAHARLHEAVILASDDHYQELLGLFQPSLALVILYEGDTEEARRLLADSLRLCLELNDKTYLARVCTYLAEAALWEGEPHEAERWLAQSLAYDADPHRIRISQVERVLVGARLAAAQGACPRAATLFGVAEAVRSQLHYELAGPARLAAETALAKVREALDPTVFAEAFHAGRQLSLAEAFATILLPLHIVPTFRGSRV